MVRLRCGLQHVSWAAPSAAESVDVLSSERGPHDSSTTGVASCSETAAVQSRTGIEPRAAGQQGAGEPLLPVEVAGDAAGGDGAVVVDAHPQPRVPGGGVEVGEGEPVDAAADLQGVAVRDGVEVADPERALPRVAVVRVGSGSVGSSVTSGPARAGS